VQERELNISSVEDDAEMLLQFLREGTAVYFFIDPYTEDLSDGQECVMCWNLSRTKAEEQYDINCEEI
jgi:hypothetical protein